MAYFLDYGNGADVNTMSGATDPLRGLFSSQSGGGTFSELGITNEDPGGLMGLGGEGTSGYLINVLTGKEKLTAGGGLAAAMSGSGGLGVYLKSYGLKSPPKPSEEDQAAAQARRVQEEALKKLAEEAREQKMKAARQKMMEQLGKAGSSLASSVMQGRANKLAASPPMMSSSGQRNSRMGSKIRFGSTNAGNAEAASRMLRDMGLL